MKKFLLVVGLLSVSGACGMEEGAMVPAKEKSLDEQLVNAAFSGDTRKISELIEKKVNLNTKFSKGLTALHVTSNKEVVLMLIENGANIEAREYRGRTPLYNSIVACHRSVAMVFIENGANVDAPNNKGSTPLYRSVVRNYEEVAIALINRGANINVSNSKGSTLLSQAAWNNNKKVAKALLLASQGKVKPKTEQELKSSRGRIFTLLCMCSKPKARKNQKGENLPILPQLPQEIQKNILLYIPEDISSAKMFAQLLPIADKEQIRGIVRCVPRNWLVMSLAEKENEVKTNLVIEEAIDYAREQATAYCSIKDKDMKTASDYIFGELNQLLDPNDTAGERAKIIREAIEKEFAKKIEDDSSSSSSSGKQEEN